MEEVLKVWKKCHEVNISGVLNALSTAWLPAQSTVGRREGTWFGRHLEHTLKSWYFHWQSFHIAFATPQVVMRILPLQSHKLWCGYCLGNATSCDVGIAYSTPQVVMWVLPWQHHKLWCGYLLPWQHHKLWCGYLLPWQHHKLWCRYCLHNTTSCDAGIALATPQVVMRVLPWQCHKLWCGYCLLNATSCDVGIALATPQVVMWVFIALATPQVVMWVFIALATPQVVMWVFIALATPQVVMQVLPSQHHKLWCRYCLCNATGCDAGIVYTCALFDAGSCLDEKVAVPAVNILHPEHGWSVPDAECLESALPWGHTHHDHLLHAQPRAHSKYGFTLLSLHCKTLSW